MTTRNKTNVGDTTSASSNLIMTTENTSALVETKMRSGEHTHYCPECEKDVVCQVITHCNRPPVAVCMDCMMDPLDD